MKRLVCALIFQAPLLLTGVVAEAQQPPPRIGYVYPAGGRRGTEFELSFGGRNLKNVTSVDISGEGITGTVVRHLAPVNGKQRIKLQEELRLLRQKRQAAMKKAAKDRSESAEAGKPGKRKGSSLSAPERQRLGEIAAMLLDAKRRRANPAIAESLVVKLSLAADAPLGRREIRLASRNGLSAPILFFVGELPELSEAAASGAALLQKRRRKRAGPGSLAPREPALTVKTPVVINGQITPGDVDRYKFHATKGQKLVIAVGARALIPYLADAVPGWFQAVLTLCDAAGKEIVTVDDYRFNPDPVILHEVSHTGDYLIEIRDSIYRGREDFVYRISVGELPFLQSIYPLGGRAGTHTAVKLRGWNLSAKHSTIQPSQAGITSVSIQGRGLTSNRLPFAAGTLPEATEREPNQSQAQAQRVTLPLVLNGRIDRPGDWDVFSFEGKRGETICAEVQARRLASPLDSVLRLTDASGREIAFNDDHKDPGQGLLTHHADSLLQVPLPETGRYFLYLFDAQQKGSEEHAYRLGISRLRPDFELRLTPSSLSLARGATQPITVQVLRHGGFSGEILIQLKDSPPGFKLSGGRIPANQSKLTMTLSAGAKHAVGLLSVELIGKAQIQGAEVIRPCVPADRVTQAFITKHLVRAAKLAVSLGRGRRPRTRNLNSLPLKIPAGDAFVLRLGVSAKIKWGRFQFELRDPPKGLSLVSAKPLGKELELTLQGDGKKLKPGLEGNLIVGVFMTPPGKLKKKRRPRRRFLGVLPAMPFLVIAKRLPSKLHGLAPSKSDSHSRLTPQQQAGRRP